MNRSQMQNLILYIWDVIGITGGYFLMTYIRFYSGGHMGWISDNRVYYRWILAVFMLTLVYLIFYPNKNFFKRKFKDELIYNLKTNGMAGVFMATAAYLIKDADDYSRFIYLGTIVFNLCWMQIVHCIYRKYVLDNRERVRTTRKILIICTKDKAEEIVSNIIKEKIYDLWVEGIIVIDADMTGQKICNIPVVANYRSMYLYATRSVVDEIFIQTSCFEKYKMQEVITKFEEMGVKVNLSIDLLNLNVQASKQLGKIGAYYTVAFTGKEASLRMLFGKRLLDIIGGLVGVFILRL